MLRVIKSVWRWVASQAFEEHPNFYSGEWLTTSSCRTQTNFKGKSSSDFRNREIQRILSKMK
jgi:hypothetical protein